MKFADIVRINDAGTFSNLFPAKDSAKPKVKQPRRKSPALDVSKIQYQMLENQPPATAEKCRIIAMPVVA